MRYFVSDIIIDDILCIILEGFYPYEFLPFPFLILLRYIQIYPMVFFYFDSMILMKSNTVKIFVFCDKHIFK